MFLSALLAFLSCDDGDLQIETLDFDSVDPQTCETLIPEDPNGYVLFKINGDEALILELPSTALKNEVATNVESTVSATGTTKVTYRIFDATVTNDYFCSSVPLITPVITEEILAEAGTVIITTDTTAVDTVFEHTISLSGISLVTSANTRITDLSINEFGTVSTTASQ